MVKRSILLSAILLGVSAPMAQANSYAFMPLEQGALPDQAAKFSSWSTLYGAECSHRLSRESLNRFLERGTWHVDDPYYAAMKKLGSDWNQWWKYEKLPEAERTPVQRQMIETHYRYHQDPKIQGAFTDKKGRIFLYWLRSPQFLEIQSDGLCYLFLSEEDKIELELAGKQRALTEIPELPGVKRKISRGPLPATGTFMTMPGDLLKAFLREGEDSGLRIKDRWDHSSMQVTSYWLKETKLVKNPLFPLRKKDASGNWLLGATVNGVISSGDDDLWFCELLSDALLLLDNGQGQYMLIEHPQAAADGAGANAR